MREAEKLAAIGEMSAMIAHDFRNPLAAIHIQDQIDEILNYIEEYKHDRNQNFTVKQLEKTKKKLKETRCSFSSTSRILPPRWRERTFSDIDPEDFIPVIFLRKQR